VIQALADVANCTSCPNWTPAKAKAFPELQLFIGTGTDKPIALNISNLLMAFSSERCDFNVKAIHKNTSSANLVDGFTLGIQYFARYTGIHYDFDNSKMAFSGVHEYIPIPNKPKKSSVGQIIAIIVIVIAAIALIAGGVAWFMKQKRLKENLNRYEDLSNT
jgi:hypothetical protein